MIEIAPATATSGSRSTAIRIVELWGRMRAAGFDRRSASAPRAIASIVEFIRWLAREELRLFTHGVTGRATAERSAAMAEAGINLVNQMLALVRKSTLLRYIAEGNVPAVPATPPAAANAGDAALRGERRRSTPALRRSARPRARR